MAANGRVRKRKVVKGKKASSGGSRTPGSAKKKARTMGAAELKEHVMKLKLARYVARRGIDYDSIKKPIKRSSSKKDEPKPKRARSAYIFFCREERPKLKESLDDKDENKVKPVEMMGMLAERWKKASKATKARFQKMADKDKIRYEKDKEEQKANEPPKRARAAYNFFVAHERPLMAEKHEREKIFAEIGRKWKAISDEDKKLYLDLEAEDKRRHEREMAKWERAKEKTSGSSKKSKKKKESTKENEDTNEEDAEE
eukprot:CAMPEP_0170170868 /NCGR_PEP_ID=MMETSP0040_2-20121228/3924_1 /TAXON_ID=641309 /ORGANISM="Lotharella oceanica, Strain CCMP622" /LENGTH=256 /DNA_ID=CAMNT_0010410571 /DNA_START=27 /DNA_END=797 /DNA_ORIENTATION=-